MEKEVVHKVYLAIQEGPFTFPTVCGAIGEKESILMREVTCKECINPTHTAVSSKTASSEEIKG